MAQTQEEQLAILNPRLEEATPHLVAYFKEVLANEDSKYWDADEWDRARAIIFYYDVEDNNLDLKIDLFDEEKDNIYAENEPDSFQTWFNRATGRDEEESFLPSPLNESDDLWIYDEFEEWVSDCWKKAFGGKPPMKAFVQYYDSNWFKDLDQDLKDDRNHLIDHVEIRKVLAPEMIEEEETNDDGFTIVTRRDGLCALKNPDDEYVTEFKYISMAGFEDGLAKVAIRSEGREWLYGFINEEGEEVIPTVYDDFGYSFATELAIISAKLNGKWGYINKDNEVVIPFMYENADDFSDGPAAVQLDGKYGFINLANEVVLPFIYETYCLSFDSGQTSVTLGGKQGTIDVEGNFTPSPEKK